MISETSVEVIYPLYRALPEFERQTTLSQIQDRIGEDYLCLAYSEAGQVVGFKLGYALSTREFYSWIGAVDGAFRGRGIARQWRRFGNREWCGRTKSRTVQQQQRHAGFWCQS